MLLKLGCQTKRDASRSPEMCGPGPQGGFWPPRKIMKMSYCHHSVANWRLFSSVEHNASSAHLWLLSTVIEVTHDEETCTRNLHRIEHCSIPCKFLVQVSWACVTSIRAGEHRT